MTPPLHRAGRVAAHAVTVVLALAVVALAATAAAGWRLHLVDSASMSPTIPRGALAVVADVELDRLTAGDDVLAFRDPRDRTRTVLHRLVEVRDEDGGVFLVTRGDANRTADPAPVPDDLVVGRLVASSPAFGAIVRALRTPAGAVALLGLPMLVLVAGVVGRRHPDADTA